jgi:hypothetical protein
LEVPGYFVKTVYPDKVIIENKSDMTKIEVPIQE